MMFYADFNLLTCTTNLCKNNSMPGLCCGQLQHCCNNAMINTQNSTRIPNFDVGTQVKSQPRCAGERWRAGPGV